MLRQELSTHVGDALLFLLSLGSGWFLTAVCLAGRLSAVKKNSLNPSPLNFAEQRDLLADLIVFHSGAEKETFYGNFFNDFPIFFFLGKLSAITYSVPEGINYSLELIVCISYSELLDALPGLDRARGHMAFLFSFVFPCSVLSVRLLV